MKKLTAVLLLVVLIPASGLASNWFTDCLGTHNCAPGQGTCPQGFGNCLGTAPAGTYCDGWATTSCNTSGAVGEITADCENGACSIGGAPCSLPAFAGACYK